MKTIVLTLAILFPAFLIAQPDISGKWEGVITQDEGGYKPEYTFELYLKQEGSKITGRSYVRVDDIYVEMELEGELVNDSFFRFHETRISDMKEFEGMEWCMKQAQLLLKKGADDWVLEGFWQGTTSFTTCIPGKVFLKKVVPRA